MKNIKSFLSKKFQFLEAKFSLYFKRHVFVMCGYSLEVLTETLLKHFVDTYSYLEL